MANATAITVNELTANGGIALPTADVLDTGTAAVTLRAALAGKGFDRLCVIIKNTGAQNLGVVAKAGDYPPAQRAGLGDLTVQATLAAGATWVLGPVESARFMQTDPTAGGLDFTFTPASGTIGVNITLLRLAKAA